MPDETDRTREGTSSPGRFSTGIAVAALLIYVASPGPVVGLLIRLKMDTDPVQKIFGIFYCPLLWLGGRVQFINDFYRWYVRLFGA
jgi:hypothetical protein